MVETEVFGFETALSFLKDGKRVTRSYWKNVKCVFLVQGSKFQVNRAPLNEFFHEGTEIEYNAHLDMLGVDNKVGVWTASMGDVLAEDWMLYADAGSANPEAPIADEPQPDEDEDLSEPQ